MDEIPREFHCTCEASSSTLHKNCELYTVLIAIIPTPDLASLVPLKGGYQLYGDEVGNVGFELNRPEGITSRYLP